MGEKNLPDKADELLTEVMNKDPLVLASISTVPYFGSTIATFFSAKWLQVYQERTDFLFRRFGEHLSTLNEQTVKRDYFDTPEGIDLLIKATEQSTKTRSDEQRDLIARILAGAASINAERGNYSPEEYVNLVGSLTVKELQIARTIRTLQQGISAEELDSSNRGETWKRCEEAVQKKHNIEGSDLSLLLNRFHNAGLVDLYYALYASGDAVPTYWTSSAFNRLMDFLQVEA